MAGCWQEIYTNIVRINLTMAGFMKLSLYADYSCRVIMYLSYRTSELTQVKDIAEIYGISHDHLRKIVHRLGTLGFLETTKGKSGGVRLAKQPKDILVGDFLQSVEASDEFVECMRKEGNTCIIAKHCRLKIVLGGALEQFFKHLNQYTFADLINDKQLAGIIGKKD